MKPPGHFLCWGNGKQGQHGHVVKTSQPVAFQEAALGEFSPQYKNTAVKLVECGSSHTVVVTEDNDIFVWGNGHCGQLGLGDEENRSAPEKVELYSLQRENPDIVGVACGSRHTVVWLTNGKTFSFGNNTFAQLAYDSKIKNYRANQTRPHLLRTLANRTVVQAACGEKHTIFLYMGGQCSVVGNGSIGQTGSSDRLEAVMPKPIRGVPPIKYVAAGANHCVVIDVTGEIWQWGQALACGKTSEEGDVVKPERCLTNHPNIIHVDGGQTHSVALSVNGSVYTWGYGPDGQLGQGKDVMFCTSPTKVKFPALITSVCRVACGDNYTAALTGSGLLYVWGKNSYVMKSDEGSAWTTFTPVLINSLDSPIDMMACGAWHMAARTGAPDWQKEDESSDIEEEPSLVSTVSMKEDDLRREVTMGLQRESRLAISRERTTISLADFYAPSPEPQNLGRALSPDILHREQKLPSIPNQASVIQQNKTSNQTKLKHVQSGSRSPQKATEPLTSLGTIQQSPRSMKTDSTRRKSLPRYIGPERTLDHQSVAETTKHLPETPSSTLVHGRSIDKYKSSLYSNKTFTSDTESEKTWGRPMDQSYIGGASVVDLNEVTTKRSSETDGDMESLETAKTPKSHKSRSEILKARLAVQGQIHKLESNQPQSNYLHSQVKQGVHPDRRKKYSLDSPNKTLPTKLQDIRNVALKSYNLTTNTPKVPLSSTNVDFVYPEPVYSQEHGRPGINRFKSRSQPVNMDKGNSYLLPKGFRGKGFYRNASKQSEYSIVSPFASSRTPLNDSLPSPSYRKLTNAASVAYQRSVAKLKAEDRRIMEQSKFNGLLPAATSVTEQTSPVKRSYAVPKRVNLLARNLIHRTNNYVPETVTTFPNGYYTEKHQHLPTKQKEGYVRKPSTKTTVATRAT